MNGGEAGMVSRAAVDIQMASTARDRLIKMSRDTRVTRVTRELQVEPRWHLQWILWIL